MGTSTVLRARRTHGLSLNLAIGPSCFVKCRGCYNSFGNTSKRGGLVTREELRRFVDAATGLGIEQVTVSGGDPLTHPEIIQILADLRAAGVFVKLDTVGTALLRDATEFFYGNEKIRKIDLLEIADNVDMIGLPLDAYSPKTQSLFRQQRRVSRGRPNKGLTLFDDAQAKTAKPATAQGDADVVGDTISLVHAFASLPTQVGINTVVHARNVQEIHKLALLINELRPDIWQLFEFQPIGRLGGYNGSMFELRRANSAETVTSFRRISIEQRLFEVSTPPFSAIADMARATVSPTITVQAKSRSDREKIYFMVNDAGLAWLPTEGPNGAPLVIGHIARDEPAVLNALRKHLQAETA